MGYYRALPVWLVMDDYVAPLICTPSLLYPRTSAFIRCPGFSIAWLPRLVVVQWRTPLTVVSCSVVSAHTFPMDLWEQRTLRPLQVLKGGDSIKLRVKSDRCTFWRLAASSSAHTCCANAIVFKADYLCSDHFHPIHSFKIVHCFWLQEWWDPKCHPLRPWICRYTMKTDPLIWSLCSFLKCRSSTSFI